MCFMSGSALSRLLVPCIPLFLFLFIFIYLLTVKKKKKKKKRFVRMRRLFRPRNGLGTRL